AGPRLLNVNALANACDIAYATVKARLSILESSYITFPLLQSLHYIIQVFLSDQQVAVDYFRTALPAHVAGRLDLSTLERRPGSYVSKELEKTVSDVVYTCRRRDGKGSVEVSLLLEHKSSPDRYTPVQVGGYLFSAYRAQLRQGGQLTPVIPILLYGIY